MGCGVQENFTSWEKELDQKIITLTSPKALLYAKVIWGLHDPNHFLVCAFPKKASTVANTDLYAQPMSCHLALRTYASVKTPAFVMFMS